jgi:hypothetical protein
MFYRWLDKYFRMKECSYLKNTGRVRESQILSVVDVCLEPSGLMSLSPKTFGLWWDNLEFEAKSGKRGLWGDPGEIPPWEFRRIR